MNDCPSCPLIRHPPKICFDMPYNRLAARLDINMFDRNRLLSFATMLVEYFDLPKVQRQQLEGVLKV